MTDEERYNGWKNHETWAVSLWLSNDEGLYNFTTERLEEAFTTAIEDAPSWAEDDLKSYGIGRAADACKDMVDELLDPESQLMRETERASMASDVGSLWRVDWYEVAGNWLEERADELVKESVDA